VKLEGKKGLAFYGVLSILIPIHKGIWDERRNFQGWIFGSVQREKAVVLFRQGKQ
jgi:hypothetical protein